MRMGEIGKTICASGRPSPFVMTKRRAEVASRSFNVSGTMNLELTDEHAAALLRELDHLIESDRFPLSPRILTLKAIRAKLRPEPAREPFPPPKHYAPPRVGDGSTKGKRLPKLVSPWCRTIRNVLVAFCRFVSNSVISQRAKMAKNWQKSWRPRQDSNLRPLA